MTWLMLLAALVPSALWLWYFLRQDLNPEPRSVLLKTFGVGVLITVPVALVESVVDGAASGPAVSPLQAALHSAFLTAAICEESAKFAVVWWYCRRHPAFDEPMDGVVYGAIASLGFATLENVLYVADGGLTVAVMRSLTAVPAHALFGATMGYFIGQAEFGAAQTRRRALALSLVVPILLHGLYDFPLMYAPRAAAAPLPTLLLVLLPFVLVWGGWRSMRRRVLALSAEQRLAQQSESAPLPQRWTPALHPAQGRGVLGVLMMVLGTVVAAAGNLVVLLVLAAVALDTPRDLSGQELAAGTFVIGGLPLIAGVWMFVVGLRRGQHAPAGLAARVAPVDPASGMRG